MWSLKCKVRNVDSIFTSLTEKYGVVDYLYPADRYKKGKSIFILGIHVLVGEAEEKKKFISALKNNSKVRHFESNNNRIVALVKEEEKFYELLYDPELYLPSPIIVEKGYELWHLASWNRMKLNSLLKEIERWKKKITEFELISLKQDNLEEIYFPQIMPKLADKQQKAFTIAVENGYYTFPRKKDLADLAKLMHITTQTYHEHLRKAEAKLLPFFAGQEHKK